ncbi:MAG: hypothetical protein ACRDS0_11595 [Pseudonocardiaceae bacterium]
MIPLASPGHRGQQTGLPAMVEELLVQVVADGFTLYCCGPKAAPRALLACYEWRHCADLLTVRDFDRVSTARVPTQGRRVDIFAPEVVVWAYEGPPQQAVRALLDLVHPAHPDAPTRSYPAPPSLRVPRTEQRPMTIQLPSPSRAGRRATRLTTPMTHHGGDRAVSAAGPQEQHKIAGWPPVEPVAPDTRLPAASRSPTTP